MAPRIDKQRAKANSPPKTTPKKIAKSPLYKNLHGKRRVWRVRHKKDTKVMQYFEQFYAYRALGFYPVETKVVVEVPKPGGSLSPRMPRMYKVKDEMGNVVKRNGAEVRAIANLCAIHALQISLNAVHQLNHPGGETISVDEIVQIWDSDEYRSAVEQRLDEHDPGRNTDLVEDLNTMDHLFRSQIALILEIINRGKGWNYRLGVYQYQADTGRIRCDVEGEQGPIVFICHSHQMNHFTGFRPLLSRQFVIDEIDETIKIDDDAEAEIDELVADGLYRIIRKITSDPNGEVGEFVFEESIPAPPGFMYGRIAHDNDLSAPDRAGFIPLESLERVTNNALKKAATPTKKKSPPTKPKSPPKTRAIPARKISLVTAGEIPQMLKKGEPKVQKGMKKLIMYFATDGGDSSAVPASGFWKNDEVLLEVTPANESGKVRVRRIDGQEDVMDEKNLEPFPHPWGISQILDDTSSPTVEAIATDWDTKTFEQLRAEIKKRREQGEIDPRIKVKPQSKLAYLKVLKAEDAKALAAENARSTAASIPLRIERVSQHFYDQLEFERDKKEHFRGLYVLEIQDDGPYNMGIAGVGGQPFRHRKAHFDRNLLPGVPWGIRVATQHPSHTQYVQPPPIETPEIEDVVELVRFALFELMAYSDSAEEGQAARDLIMLLEDNYP